MAAVQPRKQDAVGFSKAETKARSGCLPILSLILNKYYLALQSQVNANARHTNSSAGKRSSSLSTALRVLLEQAVEKILEVE